MSVETISIILGVLTLLIFGFGCLAYLQHQLKQLEERLITRLTDRLNNQTAELDQRLAAQMSGLDERLTAQMSGLGSGLTAQFTGLEARVTADIHDVRNDARDLRADMKDLRGDWFDSTPGRWHQHRRRRPRGRRRWF